MTNTSHGSGSFRINGHGIITLFRQGLERGPSAGLLNGLTNAHGIVFQNEVGKFSRYSMKAVVLHHVPAKVVRKK